jgi:hypothetical protein
MLAQRNGHHDLTRDIAKVLAPNIFIGNFSLDARRTGVRDGLYHNFDRNSPNLYWNKFAFFAKKNIGVGALVIIDTSDHQLFYL